MFSSGRTNTSTGLTTRLVRLGPAVCAILSMVLVTACAMVAYNPILPTEPIACDSNAGTYQLSRSYVSIVVHEIADAGGLKDFYIKEVKVLPKADPNFTYCLDFLASASAEETFFIKRTGMLLDKIATTSDDKSADIAKTLVKTLFVGISQNPGFDEKLAQARSAFIEGRLAGNKRFEAEFDPFDVADVALVNHALRDFGFCLLLEEQRIRDSHVNVNQYCDDPLGGQPQERKLIQSKKTRELRAPRPRSQGIFYKARLPYTVLLYVKRNRQIPGGWQLRGSEMAAFENASPVFQVAVDRTFFAKRETALDFDAGSLRDVKIKKGSELAGFVQIPLVIAQSIVALPANILQIRIDQTNNNGKLIAAQSALIETERAYLAELDKYKRARSARTTNDLDTGANRDAGLPMTRSASWEPVTQTDASVPLTGVEACAVECRRTAEGDQATCQAACQDREMCKQNNDGKSCQNFFAR